MFRPVCSSRQTCSRSHLVSIYNQQHSKLEWNVSLAKKEKLISTNTAEQHSNPIKLVTEYKQTWGLLLKTIPESNNQSAKWLCERFKRLGNNLTSSWTTLNQRVLTEITLLVDRFISTPNRLKYVDFCSKHRRGGNSFLCWNNKDLSAFTNGASAVALRAGCFVFGSRAVSVTLKDTLSHWCFWCFPPRCQPKPKQGDEALRRRINIHSLLPRWSFAVAQNWHASDCLGSSSLWHKHTHTFYSLNTLFSHSLRLSCFYSWPRRLLLALLFTSVIMLQFYLRWHHWAVSWTCAHTHTHTSPCTSILMRTFRD